MKTRIILTASLFAFFAPPLSAQAQGVIGGGERGAEVGDARPDRLAAWLAASSAARRAASSVASEAWWELRGIVTMADTIITIITTTITSFGGDLGATAEETPELTDDGPPAGLENPTCLAWS